MAGSDYKKSFFRIFTRICWLGSYGYQI